MHCVIVGGCGIIQSTLKKYTYMYTQVYIYITYACGGLEGHAEEGRASHRWWNKTGIGGGCNCTQCAEFLIS